MKIKKVDIDDEYVLLYLKGDTKLSEKAIKTLVKAAGYKVIAIKKKGVKQAGRL